MASPIAISQEQLLGDALATYESKTNVNDLNEGGVSVGLFEANAQMTYRATSAIFQILRDRAIDRATGDVLINLAAEDNVYPIPSGPSSGNINVIDSSFVKVATAIYPGSVAVNIGSTAIPISSMAGFTGTGGVYIGRGTPNIEGPLAYTSITPLGSYFVINLSTPTVKFHNISETVILAQGGNRIVQANAVVDAPSAGGAADVLFNTNNTITLLDGENLLTNVLVTAQLPGTSGNVVIGAISEFQSPPFTGATCTNPGKFSNGTDQETDDSLRARLKSARASRGLGTPLAITNAVQGAQPPDEAVTLQSSAILTSGGKTTLYVDDGTVYERKTAGVGLEFIVDSAIGGENVFQLATGGTQAGVTKAFLISGNSIPFALFGGENLAILIGGILSQHTFQASDFFTPGAATAYEIVTSINGNPGLTWNAATSNNGTQFYCIAKTEVFEYIQLSTPVTGIDAGPICGFQTNEIDTLRLYKNNIPLSKDGRTAFVLSADQDSWSNTIAATDTLILSVDGTAPITYTLTNQDFINEGTYSIVSSQNSLVSWINVFNAILTGVTATLQGDQILLTSNLGAQTRASISIDPSSTLVSKGMFTLSIGLSASGTSQDYEFDRNTAQITLLVPLSPGDQLAAGSTQTVAYVTSAIIPGSTAMFGTTAYAWILVDDPEASIIQTSAIGSSISVSQQGSNIVRYTSTNLTAFSKIQVGDYMIVWSPQLATGNQIEGRVYASTGSYVELLLTSGEYAATVVQGPILISSGFAFVRTIEVPQRVEFPTGTWDVNILAAGITTGNYPGPIVTAPLIGATVNVINNLNLVISSLTVTKGEGSILIVTQDQNATPAGLIVGSSDVSSLSLVAFQETQSQLGDYPAFASTAVTSGVHARPPDSFISSFTVADNFTALGFNPNMLVKFVEPENAPADEVEVPNQVVQLSAMTGTTMTIRESEFVTRLRTNDRVYLAYPLNFNYLDQLIVVLDGDFVNKTFTVPMYRRAITNTSQSSSSTVFNAYDFDLGPTSSFLTSFGSAFSFNDYQVLMQAKKVLKSLTVSQTAILYRAAQLGTTGENINIGYIYPASAGQPINSTVTVGNDTTILISLSSSTAVSTTIDATTQWNVTITPNVPSSGIDQVTYTWSGTGTNPGLGALVGGEYVNINQNSGFNSANQGIFRVSSLGGFLPSATSFTVARPHGAAVAQAGIPTLVSNGIQFYLAGTGSTAANIVTYVNTNLSNYITATLANDGGLSGSGVIANSTAEDSGFSYSTVFLLDGLNWISLTNLSGSPQFTFKVPLSLPTDVGYAFNNGEVVVLTPTTMEQVAQFMNILYVTGLSTLGIVTTSVRERKLQILTDTYGSLGSVQVVGGQASVQTASIIGNSIEIDTTLMKSIVLTSQASTIMTGQLMRLQATSAQAKNTGISATTSVTIVANSPTAGSSTVTLSNQQPNEIFFGAPRSNINIGGQIFQVEHQGKLVAVNWTGTGSAPNFQSAANFNIGGGGNLVTYEVPSTSNLQITIQSGTATFAALTIGDLVTLSNFENPENDGTYEVIAISSDNLTITVQNQNGATDTVSDFITIVNYSLLSGTSFTVNGVTKTEGVDWHATVDNPTTAASLASALALIANLTTNVVSNVIDLMMPYPGTPVAVTTTASGSGATINTAYMAGETYSTGSFTATVGVQEGDTVFFGTDFNILNQGYHRVIRAVQTGTECAFWIENDLAIEEDVSVISSDLVFWPYDTTVVGDNLVITTAFLNSLNVGTYAITEVISPVSVVVGEILQPLGPVTLGANSNGLYVQEGVPYYGYKIVANNSVDPANSTQTDLIFTTRFQAAQINSGAIVVATSLNKLNFVTTVENGLDGYRYDTGLIAECNRILYGDPRDSVTYPGVVAAGTDVFTDPPFFRRVQVSIAVRLVTGAPLTQITQQVQNAVQQLIDSNPIGQSIAIGDIISACEAVPGVFSAVVTVPVFGLPSAAQPTASDLISIQPAEKSKVINPAVDILVLQIGS